MPKNIMSISAPEDIVNNFEKKVFWYFQLVGHQELKKTWDVTVEHCHLRIESVAERPDASVTYRFVVAQSMCGPQLHLHGGCAATLVDNLTTVLIIAAATPGRFSDSGVSRNMRMTFLHPLPLGAEVRAVCRMVNLGRRMALTRADFYDIGSGDLCAIGVHEKVNMDREQGGRL
ncbi:thioesterase family protein [Aspergillus japonicus CBS 114.51]|uniref:Thioesterase family protein n=1 Tax=Aspergillus japonicus CBS 114.51 TaxID=1448312 RepID=A0A8T8X1J8_ASPJA|nr:thioesterase family protein [Aspergillus japonicus CBS 114.51]RAH81963.1 thioesterase family protein [Aspergillus japonicus CBS 114.51]